MKAPHVFWKLLTPGILCPQASVVTHPSESWGAIVPFWASVYRHTLPPPRGQSFFQKDVLFNMALSESRQDFRFGLSL